MYVRRAFGNATEDRVSGVVTKAHIGGLVSGLIGGLGVGALLGAGWTGVIILALIGGVAGVVSALRVRGMTVRERVWLRLRFQVRQTRGHTVVPPSASLAAIPRGMGGHTLVLEGRVVARPYDPGPVSEAV